MNKISATDRFYYSDELFPILKMKNSQIKKMPMQKKAKILFTSGLFGMFDVFEKVMKQTPKSVLNERIVDGKHTLLSFFCQKRPPSVKVIEVILKSPKIDKNKKSMNGDIETIPPFWWAVLVGNTEALDTMLSIEEIDKTGITQFKKLTSARIIYHYDDDDTADGLEFLRWDKRYKENE